MTPTEFIEACRNKYKAVGDNFYSDAEILDLLYQSEMEMAKFALTIEKDPNTSITTVSGTRAYSMPTRCLAIKRITYNGGKLKKISDREDDELTVYDESTTSTGTPLYYWIWGEKIYLRPIPDDAKTLTVYFYGEPDIITVSDSIETPSRFHMDLTDGVVSGMCYKDENYPSGDRYRKKFESNLVEARKWQQKRKRADGFNVVKNEEEMVSTILGGI